jgi:hypothetical protein
MKRTRVRGENASGKLPDCDRLAACAPQTKMRAPKLLAHAGPLASVNVIGFIL